jgi:hypothetical protein
MFPMVAIYKLDKNIVYFAKRCEKNNQWWAILWDETIPSSGSSEMRQFYPLVHVRWDNSILWFTWDETIPSSSSREMRQFHPLVHVRWDNSILWFTFSFIRNSASLVSDLKMWAIRWNCPISQYWPWLITIISLLLGCKISFSNSTNS